MTTTTDVVVIGGGIAGVSAACELTRAGRDVVLVEREPQLAQHTTGRSAAVFLASYGPPQVRALSAASRPVYDRAADELGVDEALAPRQALWLAPPEQLSALTAMLAEIPTLETTDLAETLRIAPAVRPERVAGVAIERDAAAIDVLGMHQGYLRTARRGGEGRGRLSVEQSWPVLAIDRAGSGWRVVAADGTVIDTAAVVLAAGAWCDQLGELAGARPLGLQPLRRTIAICPTSVPLDPAGPLVGDLEHRYYWRPEGPNVLCSPADETPSEPCDARPEELDVALAIERVNETTTLGLRSVITSWAGLRTFAADRVPVCGEDPRCAGLWWLAGQGGYGIQTAPAMARCLAGLLVDGTIAEAERVAGVSAAALSPARFTA